MLNPLNSLNMGEEVEMLNGKEPMIKFNVILKIGFQIKMVLLLSMII